MARFQSLPALCIALVLALPTSAAELPAPVLIGPGTTNEPGPEVEAQTLHLNWLPVPNATGYRLSIRALTKDELKTHLLVSNATNLLLGLVLGEKYRWNMVALFGTNTSPVSETLYFQVKLAVYRPRITSINPFPVPAIDYPQVFTIYGYDFLPGCQIILHHKDSGEKFNDLQIVNRRYRCVSVLANFTSIPGNWAIEIINPGGFSSGQSGFPVVTPELIPFWRWRRTGWPWTLACVLAIAVISIWFWRVSDKSKWSAQFARQEAGRAIQAAREQARRDEHNRLSRDLHDRLNDLHQISLLSGRLQVMANTGSCKLEIEKAASKVSSAVIEAVNEIEDMTWSGRPGNDNLGNVVARLRQKFGQFREFNPEIYCCVLDFPSEIPEITLPPVFNEHLLRIVSEGLRNVVKHAAATEVRLQLAFENNRLHLTIRDNGKGFSTETMKPGHGVANMDSRAKELGGKVTIQSAPGTGTKVVGEIPLS